MPGPFGDYILEERVADAGGGIVWRATNAGGEPVRLRISDPDLLTPEKSVRCFERLTAALTRWGRQDWPGVEAPAGTVLPDASGRFALATHWRDGRPALEALPAGGAERLERAVSIAIEVGAALAALHRAEAVHGAVAPHNVWVGPRSVTLLSFWWSQANLRDHPGPMSPEAISTGRFDALADQWAWGRLLATMVERETEAPGDLEAIITRSTERRPADRFPSLAEAVAALRAFERTLRTDDMSGPFRGPRFEGPGEAPTEDTLTEDLAGLPLRPSPGAGETDEPTHEVDAPTEDLSRTALDADAPPLLRPPREDPTLPLTRPGPSGPAADPSSPTISLPRAPRRATPWLLWTAALGLAALAIGLLAQGTTPASAP